MSRSALRRGAAAALLLVSGLALGAPRASAQIASEGETPSLFGIHDPGGEALFEQKGKTGWIVFTEALGADPGDKSGRDYSDWTERGHGAIVRLDYGDPPQGTLPCPDAYPAFVVRVSSFVAASKGAHIWVIGNEMNLPSEWPTCGGAPAPITPRAYAGVFAKIRRGIRALPGHASDQVIPGAVSWTAQETSSDTLQYQIDVFAALGQNGADGAALHVYTTGATPDLVVSERKMTGASSSRYAEFRSYRDNIRALPAWAQGLPIYITEARPRPWPRTNSGWVQAAYAEIDAWNRTAGNPQIHALVLFRWAEFASTPGTGIIGLLGVQEDLDAALDKDYEW